MQRDELFSRQQRLLTRSAELRITLAQQTQVFRKPLALADRAREALRWLANNPVWPLGAVLALALWRPRRALQWAGRLLWTWQTWQQARSAITNRR